MQDFGKEQGWVVQAFGIPELSPVVFLHGFMQDATTWDPIAEALASSYYIAAPTIEPISEDRASLENLAEGVYGVVQQSAIHTHQRSVLLVGYSFGGRLALEYARLYPTTLAGLILESSSFGPKDEEDREIIRNRNYSWADQFEKSASMEQIVNAWEQEPLFATQNNLSEEDAEILRKIRLRSNKQQLIWLLRHAGAHTMPLAEEAHAMLAGLQIPIMYCVGEKDAKRLEEAKGLSARKASNIRIKTFACGHNIHLENPLAFSEAVLEFAKECL